MKRANTYLNRWIGILFLAALIGLVSLSCNLPFLGKQSQSPDENFVGVLESSGLLNVDEIIVAGDQVTIVYEVLPEDDLEVMVAGWLNAFSAAAEAEPEASQYILQTNSGGEPYLEIRADGLDGQGFAAGELDHDLFLERLMITDLRPLETRLFDLLVENGVDVIEVSQAGQILTVDYYPDAADTEADLMGEWWVIFATLAEETLTVEQIQIRTVMLDTSVFAVSYTHLTLPTTPYV